MLRPTKIEVERDGDAFVGELVPESGIDEVERGKPEGADTDGLKDFLSGGLESWSGTVKWAAGGMMVVIQTEEGIFVPVGYRDGGAPTHPHNLSTPSGIADTAEELVHPRYLSFREAAEELLFLDKESDRWLRPFVPDNSEMAEIAEDCTRDLYSLWEDELDASYDVTNVMASLQPIGDDIFTLNHPTEEVERTISGNFIIDSDTHNVDLLDALFIDLSDYSIEDISIFDGEEFGDDLLDRDVYLFTPEQFATLFGSQPATAERMYSTGKVKTEEGFTDDYQEGMPVTDNFSGVPVLEKSHSNVSEFVDEMKDILG